MDQRMGSALRKSDSVGILPPASAVKYGASLNVNASLRWKLFVTYAGICVLAGAVLYSVLNSVWPYRSADNMIYSLAWIGLSVLVCVAASFGWKYGVDSISIVDSFWPASVNTHPLNWRQYKISSVAKDTDPNHPSLTITLVKRQGGERQIVQKIWYAPDETSEHVDLFIDALERSSAEYSAV